MSNIVKRDDNAVEYVPFGARESIKLSVGIIQQFVANPTREGDLPSPRDAMKFLMLCRAGQLNPFAGDAFLVGYRDRNSGSVAWSLITSISAFYKRAEACANYDGIESGVIVRAGDGSVVDRSGDFMFDDDTLLGGWAKVYRKDRKFATERRVKLETYLKPYGVWKNDPAGMICKVAECHALRDTFPTMLGGLHSEQEMGGDVFEGEVKAPKRSLNELLSNVPDDPKPAPAPQPEPPAPTPAPTQTAPAPQKHDADDEVPEAAIDTLDGLKDACAGMSMEGATPEQFEKTWSKVNLLYSIASAKPSLYRKAREMVYRAFRDGRIDWETGRVIDK